MKYVTTSGRYVTIALNVQKRLFYPEDWTSDA